MGAGPPNPYAPPGAPPPITDAPGGSYGYAPIECPLAGEALKYAIVGLFCCGVVLGPIAIYKGVLAKRMIAETPGMTGDGKATAAIVVGGLAFALTALSLLLRLYATMRRPGY